MSLLRPVTLTWWQIGIFKVSLFALGAAAGAYWNEFFAQYLTLLLVVGVVAGVYVAYAWFRQ